MSALLAWYDAHKRDLPWRKTRDPYAIWVCEIMAQQTTIAAILPRWTAWLEHFPTVQSLAKADEEEIMRQWQGLGYYRRARLMHAAAKIIAETGFPETEVGLLELPGIGPYSAAAIASICFDRPAAVVDTNVLRVYARLVGDDRTGDALRKAAKAWGDANIDRERPGHWNQAIMELGGSICNRTPQCEICPLGDTCVAREKGIALELPRQTPRPAKKEIDLNVLILTDGHRVAIEKSTTWWVGLSQFPTVKQVPGGAIYVGKHKATVTNHTLSIAIYTIEKGDPSLTWLDWDELKSVPLSSVMRRVGDIFQGWLRDAPALDGLSA